MMKQLNKPIGLLGGTFDPIHFGHLRMALELHDVLDLAKVHIIPCFRPVHRKMPLATPEQRMAMVACAVADESSLVADNREIKQQEPSYTINTLLEMQREFPNTPLCFILGIDAFLGFTSWHRWEEILKQSHLIVAHRPNYQLPGTGVIAEVLKQHLQTDISYIHENLAGGILLRPITSIEISATDIRKQIAGGKNPRYLIPDKVYEYIKQHSIYSIGR